MLNCAQYGSLVVIGYTPEATGLRPSQSAMIKNNETKKVISTAEWDSRLSQININKGDIDRIVLNYLVIEGFKEAAQEFVTEAGLEEVADVNQLDLGSIDYRLRVRQAIQSGQISTAIQELNNFDPEILDSSPSVYFHLRLQELLEKIRSLKQSPGTDEMSAVLEVIEFAREFLAPVAQEQAGGVYLEELEEVMGLLAAEMGASWPADALLLPENRLKTAKEVNSAILASQAQPEQSKLPEILSLLKWAQERLAERAVFPKLIDPVSGTFEQ